MKARIAISLGAALTAAVMLEAPPAEAHNWGCWKQPDRTVRTRNTASRRAEANAAISEWDSKTILSLPLLSTHTDISVFDGNYGNTGWGGLASIESSSGCNILHGHARVNLYYGGSSNAIRGIFCQEVGHLFGLDHSNDGGCMGGGYFYPIGTFPGYTVVSHNVNDIAAKYSSTPALAESAGEAAAAEAEPGSPRAIATWQQRAHTLAEALKLSSAVVVARVTAVSDAEDIVVPVPGLEEGEDRIPTQRISFSVSRSLLGRVDGSFELFHTGNAEFVLDEDGPYKVGESYVLFLAPREDGSYRLISPDGRFLMTKRGLEPAAHEGFTTLLRGASLRALTSDVAQILGAAADK